MYLVLVKLY
ncbi:Ditrans,polycis-undecaprenyl-diphosphate synthase ((2E,6E)-farnesyl-diphosphate specific), partial [Haemophilus influenzae]